MVTVLLVDGWHVVRRGLLMRFALEPDIRIVGAAKNSEEALLLAHETIPDIVVIDVETPGVDGFQVVRQMRDLVPNCTVVVLTMHGGKDMRARAFRAGAQALIEKQDGAEPLLREIRRLAACIAGQ